MIRHLLLAATLLMAAGMAHATDVCNTVGTTTVCYTPPSASPVTISVKDTNSSSGVTDWWLGVAVKRTDGTWEVHPIEIHRTNSTSYNTITVAFTNWPTGVVEIQYTVPVDTNGHVVWP